MDASREQDLQQLCVRKNQRQLRAGYTTGSCAAAAAKAAAYRLLSGETLRQVSLTTPKGIILYLEVEEMQVCGDTEVSCAIRKDSGDDPDVTNGILVYAGVRICIEPGLHLKGGEGIGIVTRKGLEQKVGQPAINKVPRQMILEAVKEQCIRFGYEGGLEIRIWMPQGEELAKRTFNARLGIEGGLSVLGTTGIVEPMSEKALTDTIYLEMKMLKENGQDWCYVVPGNYGSDFLTQTLQFDGNQAVKCSNYIGETIDAAVVLGMKGILLVGHVGKLIKLAAGIMNTHSAQADGRMEILASHAAMAGADQEQIRKLMQCLTTTEAMELLKESSLLSEVMRTVMERIAFHLKHRGGERLSIGAILFSQEDGILGCTPNTEALIQQIQGENYERKVLWSGSGAGRSGITYSKSNSDNQSV